MNKFLSAVSGINLFEINSGFLYNYVSKGLYFYLKTWRAVGTPGEQPDFPIGGL